MHRSRSPARPRGDPRGRTERRSRSRSPSHPSTDPKSWSEGRQGYRRSRSRSRSPRRGSGRIEHRPRQTRKERWDSGCEEQQERESGHPNRMGNHGREWREYRAHERYEDRTKAKEAESRRSNPPTEADGSAQDDTVEDEEAKMMALMGIPVGFGSSKGQQVDDPKANVGDAMVKTKRQARQYMNRRGGFNRPLPSEKTGQRHLYGQ
mmetsp:Transcript_3563/g.22400  ORF Transcript_3563/g.22400 Transcript_3563/m.22400 type:complete len:207 (+) Transcript_3563:338-958(+)